MKLLSCCNVKWLSCKQLSRVCASVCVSVNMRVCVCACDVVCEDSARQWDERLELELEFNAHRNAIWGR